MGGMDAVKAEAVLAQMREGKSMRAACREVSLSHVTFLGWVEANETLADQYARARDSMIDAMAEELLTIADEDPGLTNQGATDAGAVAHQRLRVDTRKWLLSKVAPKKYGDRIEVAGDKDAPLITAVKVEFIKP